MSLKSPNPLRWCAVFAALLALPAALSAATGEITKSGSTWTAKVDGVTRYTGTDLVAAVWGCSNNMSSGTINLRASGSVGGEARIKSNHNFNGNGYTITSNYAGGVIRAKNVSNSGATNVKIAGSPWFGMYFQTCATQTFSGISGTGGILMRIDQCSGGRGSNFNGGSPTCTASGSHGVETYGINTANLTTVTATDRSGGCGLLWNETSNGRVRNVYATRCNYSGGYAGYRQANNNTECYLDNQLNSTSCGRGFFALTGSNNGAVAKMSGVNNRDIGIWIQNCVKIRVVSGSISGSPCYSVSGSGSYANVSCN